MLNSLPNLLTISRILAIPAICAAFYLPGSWSAWLPLGLFAAAGITDWFDGYLARKWGQMSDLGRFLDPVADKLLVCAVIMMLIAFERIDKISLLAAVVIMCREITVTGLREFLAELRVKVPVSQLAKWKTTVQLIALGFLIVGHYGPGWLPVRMIGEVMLWVAALLTLYTGWDYLITGLRHMAADPRPAPEAKPKTEKTDKETGPQTGAPA
ncbi:CDP-diacylglycerol--glycerol-3-phosphate 3-phosphatidyltransferase [Ferrovibrio sp.]|uniref:CDP-diacylglycerol--glycerol-3-phosphate 3-phosphatidyltransferase n=1 Tax=Ferrovibrio sp. TaxID=1917215 RepID=UPI0025BA387C|nr:CDP-diacylglycerol--glycerol-3-phosphate 3-phosphatidyltransferase [Ferrovibrio sp.]MBX3455077.1 CDP-diacylglycerol--glycerol-3-phosphate 3-phosphatidyltransferase [Ferrovibrio sp.]